MNSNKMNFKNLVWKKAHTKVWFLVSTILMTLIFVVTMVATNLPLARNTLEYMWGGLRPVIDGDRGLFVGQYETKEEVLDAANAFNVRLAEEGFVLLRNENDSLPLNNEAAVSVFGRNSVELLYGGSGSGAKLGDARTRNIFESLEDAGFRYNSVLRTFYEGRPGRPVSPSFDTFHPGFPTGERPVSELTANTAVMNSYAQYNDAALVVITRIGGEGFDLPRTMGDRFDGNSGDGSGNGAVTGLIEGARRNTDHYLQLDANEVDLLMHVAYHFDNVILIINSNNALELGFLDDPSYWQSVFGITDAARVADTMANLRGALWIGSPGGYGIMALGRILNGTVNPSGRMVNIHARDFRLDPVWNNFGDQSSRRGNAYLLTDGRAAGAAAQQYFVEYEEGIFLGYRYWETRAYEMQRAGHSDWYNQRVVFPFGWGLSYSTFEWELGDVRLARRNAEGELVQEEGQIPSILTAEHYDVFITVDVRVTHAGGQPGKDVVQLYVRTPYTINGIEKAHVVLMDFAKTDLLGGAGNPSYQTLTLVFNMFDIASYDFNDANGNGFYGWETEAGEYTIYISRHSNSWARPQTAWDAALSVDFEIAQAADDTAANGRTGLTFRYDPHTPNSAPIVNRFCDAATGAPTSNITFLSRSHFRVSDLETNPNYSFPTPPTVAERSVGEIWTRRYSGRPDLSDLDQEGTPWFSSEMPNQASRPMSARYAIALYDMMSVPFGDEQWNLFLNQLTFAQMANLIGIGGFGTVPLINLGIPLTIHADGPAGFTAFMQEEGFIGQPPIYDTAFYVSSAVIGATFSREMARGFGYMIGNEALVGDERGGGLTYSGWYAPGVNIHRSPFSGRNWEYFSEDPILSGRMAAQVVAGARYKGVITFAKHFALNDQDTNRSTRGLVTWANEQSMREIYLRVFEILVKEGDSLGIMTSYNRIGTTWAGACHNLLTKVLREEWGFRGVVITDFYDPRRTYMMGSRKIRAGGDLQLSAAVGKLHDGVTNPSQSATHVTAMRNASKNILYAVVNSNAMNPIIVGYRMPNWVILLIVANVILLAGFLVWGFFALNVLGIIKGKHELSKKKAGIGADADVEDAMDSEEGATSISISANADAKTTDLDEVY